MADGDRIPKVLVVDDEPNIRELVEVALKFHGCAVAVSASGKDALHQVGAYDPEDRKSTRLNSSHGYISYAVFCLKKKKTDISNLLSPLIHQHSILIWTRALIQMI